jgi:hypothetical protein
MRKKPRPPPEPDTRPTVEIALAVIDAACALRDFDWNCDDPSPLLDAIDRAVDAWRRRLRERTEEAVDAGAIR